MDRKTMTVADLVAKLTALPQDLRVVVLDGESEAGADIALDPIAVRIEDGEVVIDLTV